MLSILYVTCFSFEMHFKISSAICFYLDQSKISSSGNGLKTPTVEQLLSTSNLIFLFVFNPLPDDNIWAQTKLKAFANDNFNVAKILISLFHWVENIVRKGDNVGYQHFLSFLHHVFERPLCQGHLTLCLRCQF